MFNTVSVKLSLAAAAALLATAASSPAASVRLSDSLDGWDIGYLVFRPAAADPEPYVAELEDNAFISTRRFGDPDFRPGITLESQTLRGYNLMGLWVTRDLHMRAGDTVSGYVRAASWDSDGGGLFSIGSVSWDETGVRPRPPGEPYDVIKFGSWYSWSFTAPSAGVYPIYLGVESGTMLEAFTMLSDVTHTTPDPVTTLGLLSASLLSLVAVRRR